MIYSRLCFCYWLLVVYPLRATSYRFPVLSGVSNPNCYWYMLLYLFSVGGNYVFSVYMLFFHSSNLALFSLCIASTRAGIMAYRYYCTLECSHNRLIRCGAYPSLDSLKEIFSCHNNLQNNKNIPVIWPKAMGGVRYSRKDLFKLFKNDKTIIVRSFHNCHNNGSQLKIYLIMFDPSDEYIRVSI